MRVMTLAAGLMLIAGSAFAQEDAAPALRAPVPGAPAARPAGNANAIRPGSMIVSHGQSGFGGSYGMPPGFYRENPGNGLYGAAVGDYGGEMSEQLPL